MYRTHRQHSLLSSGGVPSFIGGLVVFVSAAFNAQAETWFDPAFFKDDPSMVADLSRFEKGQKITPGVYRVDIVLNQTIVDTRNVNFVELTGNDSNLLIVFYVQIMPDDFVMQLHRF
ncbi:FimD/PapC N-terminal domain-containing protein [Escherichia coli]|uniref:FimD/PapC N-terminal domain-containing protein n=1 Tax=Escherichia coli TaxID=562 RepID=UPI00067AE73B